MLRKVAIATSLALAAAIGLSACGQSEQGDSTDAEAGSTTVRVTLANHVWTDIIKEKLPEFEAATGLTVELTQLGEDQLSDQYNVKLNAGTGDIDVMMYRPLQEGKLFAQNGYLADITDETGSNADWDWNDFQSGPVQTTTHEDAVVGVPLITEQEVLYYRKDLVEAAGYSGPPETLEELKEMAETIQEQNPGIAGFVARTARSQAVTQFSSFLYSFGGDFIDSNGDSSINTPEAKEAYAFYGGLIRENGPENVSTDMGWPEAMAIFTQGQAAFYTEANSLYKNATDPANSKVAETVGFAAFPAGPAGSVSYSVPSWALGINEASENQANAWTFIEWATSQERTLETQKAGVPGARKSVWADPTGIADYPADMVEAIEASTELAIGRDRPIVIRVPEAREIVGQPIVEAITGGDVDASAEESHEAFQQFLEDERE